MDIFDRSDTEIAEALGVAGGTGVHDAACACWMHSLRERDRDLLAGLVAFDNGDLTLEPPPHCWYASEQDVRFEGEVIGFVRRCGARRFCAATPDQPRFQVQWLERRKRYAVAQLYAAEVARRRPISKPAWVD